MNAERLFDADAAILEYFIYLDEDSAVPPLIEDYLKKYGYMSERTEPTEQALMSAELHGIDVEPYREHKAWLEEVMRTHSKSTGSIG